MKKVYCPVDDYECPYCDDAGYCQMEKMEGCDPREECDAFVYEDEEEDGLTYCPNCGGERFNDKRGFCVDCGYDEKEENDDE